MTPTNVTELRRVLREQQKCAYRDAILDSAERLLRSSVTQTITMIDVATESRISVGTVYNYFKNKDDLVAAVQHRQNERFLSQLRAGNPDASPIEELESFIRTSLVWIEQSACASLAKPHSVALCLTLDPTTSMYQFDDDELRQYEQLLTQRVQRAVPSDLGTLEDSAQRHRWCLLVLLRAAVVDWIQSHRSDPPSTKSSLVVKLFLACLSMPLL
ncbi:MAG: TetR/AcrR family transcriptional regulator [Polyangiaceae bacterium]